MPRMRTISECARLLKQDDPETAFTQNAIRSLVLSGKLPHVKIGTKRLINYDRMLELLQDPMLLAEQNEGYGTIRRVV